jgi:hypothetical protein
MLHDVNELKELNIEVGYDEETTFGNYTIKVMADHDPISPREWDNLGTMVCFGNYGYLGDVNGQKEYYNDRDRLWHELSGLYDEEHTDYLTDGQIERVRKVAFEKHIILPLYIYDHSGITMNTSGFSCPWDSGQVGYIYISLEKVREEYGCKRVSKKMRERIAGYLRNEVKTFDQFITGDVYGYDITREDEDGEEVDVDSCWGFYGYDDPYMTEEVIKGAIRYDIENTPAQLELSL